LMVRPAFVGQPVGSAAEAAVVRQLLGTFVRVNALLLPSVPVFGS
jgi:hypothetical protein